MMRRQYCSLLTFPTVFVAAVEDMTVRAATLCVGFELGQLSFFEVMNDEILSLGPHCSEEM